MKHIFFACVGLLFAVTCLQAPVAAQNHLPSARAGGELKGLVLDPSEARIVGAKITVENEKYSFEVESNDEGAFEIKLPSGEYQFTIRSPGFGTFVRNRVRVGANKTKTINATLWPAPMIDTLPVSPGTGVSAP